MNSVNIIGRLTRDVEIRYAQNDNATAIARTSIAVDNPFSDNTDFINVIAFGKTAEFLENYITKGARIGLTGRIQTGSYDHKDGYTVYTTDVVISNVYFADGVKEDKQTKPSKPTNSKNNQRGSYKSNGKK